MHSRNSYSSSGNINARQKYLYKEITSSSPIDHNTKCLPETQTSLYEKVHFPTHSHIDMHPLNLKLTVNMKYFHQRAWP